jgi:hypothetical protein
LFHALPANAPHDHVFFNTFTRGFIISHGVTAAAVQQAVKARACAVGQAALFEQYGRNAAHAKIAQGSYACCAAADDDNSSFKHGFSSGANCRNRPEACRRCQMPRLRGRKQRLAAQQD